MRGSSPTTTSWSSSPTSSRSVLVEDGRRFTLVLREGHRWSDGHPFTTADFRYWWENVANNKRLSPGGPPMPLLADGKPPTVEILDERRIRYSWTAPNPLFLPALAAPQPTYIYFPAHYLRQFHESFANATELQAAVRAHRLKDWTALHEQKARLYRNETPIADAGALAEHHRAALGALRLRAHPVLPQGRREGQQLPYIDRIIINTATSSLIPTKVGAGDSDLQARYLSFDNYTFLRVAAKSKDFSVKLWKNAEGARIAIYPNLNAADPSGGA